MSTTEEIKKALHIEESDFADPKSQQAHFVHETHEYSPHYTLPPKYIFQWIAQFRVPALA